jgi:hypothetical protein
VFKTEGRNNRLRNSAAILALLAKIYAIFGGEEDEILVVRAESHWSAPARKSVPDGLRPLRDRELGLRRDPNVLLLLEEVGNVVGRGTLGKSVHVGVPI